MNRTELRFRTASALLATVTTAFTLIASVGVPVSAHASIDEPWPEPPSCSNETGTCSTMEDIVAYDCYFEKGTNSPFHFCDDPLAAHAQPGLVAPDHNSPNIVVPQSRK